ncbi:hypothetical protein HDU96_010452 [Phlyctochytrium bullatum]|nr:hypothetical protein HDU96_010452 [Phlyctochytrium bullatum]
MTDLIAPPTALHAHLTAHLLHPPPPSLPLLTARLSHLSRLTHTRNLLLFHLHLDTLRTSLASGSPTSAATAFSAARALCPPGTGRAELAAAREAVAKALEERLRQALFGCGWPQPWRRENGEPEEVWRAARELGELERVEGGKDREQAIKCMAGLVTVFVKFHFKDKKMRRDDKPEWLLTYLTQTLTTHLPLFHLASHRLSVPTAPRILAQTLLDHAHATLVPVARRLATSRPALLAHLVEQCAAFDEGVKAVVGGEAVVGVAGRVCEETGVVEAWIEVERRNAVGRLEEVFEKRVLVTMETPAGKSTAVAELVVDMLQTIMERTRPLPPSSHLLFYTHLHHPLLTALTTSLTAAHTTLSHLFLPITSDSTHDQAVAARVSRVCAVLTTAAHVAAVLEAWEVEVPVAEVWEEAGRTWGVQGREERWGAGVFAKRVEELKRVEREAADLLVEIGEKEFVEALWAYEKKRDWTDLRAADVSDAPTSTLLPVLALLRSHLALLTSSLDPRRAARASRALARACEAHVVKRVVLRGEFSGVGAKVLKKDLESLEEVFGGVYGFPVWKECLEVLMAPLGKVEEWRRGVGVEGFEWLAEGEVVAVAGRVALDGLMF